jgi:hypothetical protein
VAVLLRPCCCCCSCMAGAWICLLVLGGRGGRLPAAGSRGGRAADARGLALPPRWPLGGWCWWLAPLAPQPAAVPSADVGRVHQGRSRWVVGSVAIRYAGVSAPDEQGAEAPIMITATRKTAAQPLHRPGGRP